MQSHCWCRTLGVQFSVLMLRSMSPCVSVTPSVIANLRQGRSLAPVWESASLLSSSSWSVLPSYCVSYILNTSFRLKILFNNHDPGLRYFQSFLDYTVNNLKEITRRDVQFGVEHTNDYTYLGVIECNERQINSKVLSI